MAFDYGRNTRGTIVLGTTASDPHVVPIYLAKIMLEEQGYGVRNMRCFNSGKNFAIAVRSEADVRAVVVANNNGAAAEDLADMTPLYDAEGARVPVIMGGHFTVGVGSREAEEAELRTRGVTHFCSDLNDLIPLLDRLTEDMPCSTPA